MPKNRSFLFSVLAMAAMAISAFGQPAADNPAAGKAPRAEPPAVVDGQPTGVSIVIPSRLRVGEAFAVKVRVLGEVVAVPPTCFPLTAELILGGQFNAQPARGFVYQDNCLPRWRGTQEVRAGDELDGPRTLQFDGKNQGVFSRDTRPIKTFDGFRFARPGFHFVRLVEPVSGIEALSNAVYVSEDEPVWRIYWGDPHFHSIFSDGLRGPEDLYAFARREGFLDFAVLTDHAEALSDPEWRYMMDVTNTFYEPGAFATLVAHEWTNMSCGHRNLYFRAGKAPIFRSDDKRYDTPDKLWRALEGQEVVAIPHHTSNVQMGVKWSLGWNATFERAVEMYSVWGSSERHAEDGNLRPIKANRGEMRGRHVIDAMNKGYRFAGFVGGGDEHKGRPGDSLAYLGKTDSHPQGLTAVLAPALSRENVYDAIKEGRTYATTARRIYLDAALRRSGQTHVLTIRAASEDGLAQAEFVQNGSTRTVLAPSSDEGRILEVSQAVDSLKPGDYCYVRVLTQKGDMAWSSPVWIEQ